MIHCRYLCWIIDLKNKQYAKFELLDNNLIEILKHDIVWYLLIYNQFLGLLIHYQLRCLSMSNTLHEHIYLRMKFKNTLASILTVYKCR